MKELRDYIKQISTETTEFELDYIISKFIIRKVPKGNFLIQGQQTCKEFSIVKKGSFKIFYTNHDNANINVWFAFEKMPSTEMHSFITQQPTHYSVQALEDTEIYTIEYNHLQELYRQFNSFQNFGLKMTEQILVKTIDRLTSFQFETAEQRYEKIAYNSNYSQRIPLRELASFLGITPNSLSRLRKSISKK
jgi:CRP/FNR family transcriptional regulator, anaerobic regulatory protein